ncbi:hypothetical protein E1B28_010538 [Marasmius oreades]|uniref:TEA domain-containing protein n=1 Tax=Marasmius oreades TaxID=181124 RepID=A0A9P7RY03_9AGAR|nr:uncharacterized protein E1B28_010538 [Marasmius oreades]KAG7091510.1 hypothetical protein E1B28_010538 [Marasmius oreades]
MSWRTESTSPVSSPSPSPTLVDNLRLSADDDVKCCVELGTKEVFRDVVKGRKSWKTLKGGEMVWPPELEAALLEGLSSYQPDDSRETRLLGRFPMRNRYISAYILQKTGKHRTAKQVGSRLQQLRDTCGTKKLQHLLSPSTRKTGSSPALKTYHYGSLQRYGLSVDSSSSSDTSSPSSPISDTPEANWSQAASPSVMYICILPEHSYDARLSSENSSSISSLGAVSRPRSIHTIDPTLAFTSYSVLDRSARSVFEVYHSQKHLVHREECPLTTSQTISGVDEEGRYLYSTSLIPGYWEMICNDADPTQYTIEHKVVQNVTGVSSSLFTAVYKFRYPLDATFHRNRISSATDFSMSAGPYHHGLPFECATSSDNSFDIASLSADMGYNNPEMGPIFATSCYSNESGSVSPRSETSLGYDRRDSDSLSPPPSSTWFYTQSSRPNY